MTLRAVLIAVACLFGAAGIALHAAAAHGAGEALGSAATMVLGHAPALLAVVLALDAGRLSPRLGELAAFGLALGVTLFALDIAVHQATGSRLFPMAAPTGGSLAIGSWLLLGVAALLARR